MNYILNSKRLWAPLKVFRLLSELYYQAIVCPHTYLTTMTITIMVGIVNPIDRPVINLTGTEKYNNGSFMQHILTTPLSKLKIKDESRVESSVDVNA
jgi:hypothetical protein